MVFNAVGVKNETCASQTRVNAEYFTAQRKPSGLTLSFNLDEALVNFLNVAHGTEIANLSAVAMPHTADQSYSDDRKSKGNGLDPPSLFQWKVRRCPNKRCDQRQNAEKQERKVNTPEPVKSFNSEATKDRSINQLVCGLAGHCLGQELSRLGLAINSMR